MNGASSGGSSRQASHRRAILHVGTEKTGTTTLQNFLATNRRKLAGNGYFFPQSLGTSNHTVLVAASEDDGFSDNIKAHILAREKLTEAQLRRQLMERLDAEDRKAGAWHTLVISSELIHSRLHTESEIDRLLSFFRERVDEIVVVAALRRQDKLAVSRMSSAIRAGHQSFEQVFGDIGGYGFQTVPPGRDVDDHRFYYDYANLADRFARVLGDGAMHVHLYDDDGRRLDPIAMIAGELGIDAGAYDRPVEELNRAMSAEAQHVIAALNRRFATTLPDGQRNPVFLDLKRRIEKELAGAPRQVERGAAQAFLAHFAASNEVVRKRFFPDRAQLFDEDFGMYPQSVDYSGLEAQLAGTVETYARQLEAGMKHGAGRGIGSRIARSVAKLLAR